MAGVDLLGPRATLFQRVRCYQWRFPPLLARSCDPVHTVLLLHYPAAARGLASTSDESAEPAPIASSAHEDATLRNIRSAIGCRY